MLYHSIIYRYSDEIQIHGAVRATCYALSAVAFSLLGSDAYIVLDVVFDMTSLLSALSASPLSVVALRAEAPLTLANHAKW